MKYVALISETNVGYGEQTPFHGSRQFTLLGLYNGADISGTVARMMKQQRKRATSGVETKEFEGQAAVDDIAIDLAKNGIFHGAVSGKVGYIAFRTEDQEKARELFDSL